MSRHTTLVPSLRANVHGWQLAWRVPVGTAQWPGTRLTHWFCDVDDALAVKWAMDHGESFEAAHAQLFRGDLNVEAAAARRVARRAARLAREVARQHRVNTRRNTPSKE